jgi:hypothetical protein
MIALFLRRGISHGISHGRTALGNTITVAQGTGNTDVKNQSTSQNISSHLEVEVNERSWSKHGAAGLTSSARMSSIGEYAK